MRTGAPFWTVLATGLSLAACGRRESSPRVYEEPAPPTTAAERVATLPAEIPMPPPATVTWQSPAGWQEQQGWGMRRASFRIEDGGHTYECSLVALPGEAGGAEANVRRWAGQLGLSPSAEQITALLDAAVERPSLAGHPLRIFDFGALQPGAESDAASLLAAIVRRPSDTLFLKFLAPCGVLERHRGEFERLAESLK